METAKYFLFSFFALVITGLVLLLLFNPASFSLLKELKFYVVTSGSMEPAIGVGSVILVTPQTSYNPNEIITFMPNGSSKTIVTHRIKSEDLAGGKLVYKTAGDANNDVDNWQLNKDQIIGKVAFSLPWLGYLIDFAKQPNGFIVLVIIPATIFVYEELRSLKKEASKLLKKETVSNYQTVPINLLPATQVSHKGLPKILLLVSLVGIGMFFITFSAAQYLDQEKSTGNIFSAAATFPTPAPLISPLSGHEATGSAQP